MSSKLGYLSCVDVYNFGSEIVDDCLNDSKMYLESQGQDLGVVSFSIILEKYPLYRVYRIESPKEFKAF